MSDKTPFSDWFWQVIWNLDYGGHYTLADLPHIYFEVAAMYAGCIESDEEGYHYIDEIMLADADCDTCGDVIMHKDWKPND